MTPRRDVLKRAVSAGAVLAAALAFSSCARRQRPQSVDTVALVLGRPVSLRSFRVYFEANTGRPIAESSPKVASGLFDQFLREEIWRADARLSGTDEESDRENAPSLLLSRAGAAVVPTDQDVQKEYDLHRDRYRKPEQVRAARIFTKQRGEADNARQRISRGEEFSTVAKAVSRAPDAASGGQMGWVERGDLPSEFESAIFRLKAGEVSPVIEAEEGFLIFKAEDRAPARELTLDQAGPEIHRRLLREKADAYLQSLIETSRRQNTVRVFPDRLPFVYTGEFLPPGKD
ncbi:MAG: peptidylprolyl isomerase [Thermoanaerobaculia bacterium]